MNVVSLLSYDYVPDIVERRVPHREGHLALIARYHEAGDCLLAGAVGDPPRAGALVFRTPQAAADFLAEDPYVAAGLVPAHRIDPWALVAGP